MRKTLMIAKREYKAAVRSKAFLVSVVAMPVLMGGSILAMALLEDRVDTKDKRIVVMDRSEQVLPYLMEAAQEHNETEIFDEETGEQRRPAYLLEPLASDAADPQAQRMALSERVRAHELHAFLELGSSVLDPTADPEEAYVRYYSENSALDDLRGWFSRRINQRLRNLRLAEMDLDEAAAARLLAWTEVEGLGLVTVDEATGELVDAERSSEARAIVVPMVAMMLLFMVVLMGASPLVSAVLEEKMQRIAEVLLGSVKPFELMLGKLLGTLAVSYTIIAIYLAGIVYAGSRAGFLSAVPMDILPWFLIYQAAAILMFGSLYIAVGASCNDNKEAQSLMMPVLIIAVVPFFVWMIVLESPLSAFATWASMVPTATPFLMLVRQTSPATIPAWQPWAGLAGVLLFTLLAVWLSGRIFRVGLLMQGKAPKPAELLRWALKG
jgi:ABC-2 type transport system permease protein